MLMTIVDIHILQCEQTAIKIRCYQRQTDHDLDWITVMTYEQLTASETTTLTKLSRITGPSWSITSIIGLSSSCRGQSTRLQSVTWPSNLSAFCQLIIFDLRLCDGHKETSYFFEDGDGESAAAQLTGAEQYERQSLHSVQHSGVRTVVCRCLETRAGLQHKHGDINMEIKQKAASCMTKMISYIPFLFLHYLESVIWMLKQVEMSWTEIRLFHLCNAQKCVIDIQMFTSAVCILAVS